MAKDSTSVKDNSQLFKQSEFPVYFAARDGHALILHSQLVEIGNKHTQNGIINKEYHEEDGQKFTPLCVAARCGRSRVIQMILANYLADLERECTVKFDGHIVQGATALWCAAGSGHLNIVKMLVQHGANVNHRTKSHSTPLRAACFDGRLDIVKYLVDHNADINIANAYNNTCLMISAYKGHMDVVEFLLANGAKPNEAAHCGATALHYAAECGHVDVCRTLLDFDAVLKQNEHGMSPVISAAERTRELVVSMFYSRPNLLTKLEQINALELLGASFANDKDNYNISKAYHYLNLAMKLRYDDAEDVVRKILCPPVPAYENWIESQTLQELEALQANHNSIHMESLAVRERILGRSCPDVAHPVVFRGAICADNGRFDRCESLWLHALELRQFTMLSVQRDLLRFAQVFSQMIQVGYSLRYQNVLTVLESCILEIGRNTDKLIKPGPKDDVELVAEEYESNIVTALYLLTIITKLIKNPELKLDTDDMCSVYRLVLALNKMNLKLRDGQTLLHLAVNGITPVDDFHTNDVCRFPCVDTVKLLLSCGASVTDVDCERNTALHILTLTHQQANPLSPAPLLEVFGEITKLIIDAGGHVDAVNAEGLKASQICSSSKVRTLLRRFESNELSLKCLASKCIALHHIDYKELIPKHLEKFVQLHSAYKVQPKHLGLSISKCNCKILS